MGIVHIGENVDQHATADMHVVDILILIADARIENETIPTRTTSR